MKRILIIMLSLTLLLVAVACGDSKNDNAQNDSSETDSSADVVTDGVGVETFDENGKYKPLNYDFPKVMKLTQWDLSNDRLLLASSGGPLAENTVRQNAKTAMENIKKDGFNTVLLQMRPFADSFYSSQYYPLSRFVTGSYGNQSVKYDMVQIFIEEAHKVGLSIHGWINPMRCMTESELKQVTGNWAITDWYSHMGDDSEYSEYMFSATDGGGTTRLYLNPAYEDIRNLIINGVDEILSNYRVDGIFMDDYFYPESVKNNPAIDAKAFAARTDGSTSVYSFRCNSVNTLVRGIYSKVKEHGADYIYGISPNGDISYASQTECADIATWCSEAGYCDIMYPQFYYGMMHGEASVSALMAEWHAALTEKSVKLIPVLTLNKAGKKDQWAVTQIGKDEWTMFDDIILESMSYLLVNEYRNIDGLGFFCYSFFHGGYNESQAVKDEIANFMPLWADYQDLIGKTKAELKAHYQGIGLDLVALGADWDDRLSMSTKHDALFNID